MYKSILFITILLHTCHANIDYVEKLQAQFNKEVIELNIYKKRFNKYLEQKCKDDLQCYKEQILHLKSWNTVQQDTKLFDLMN